jgi:hypothetical protein
VAIDRRIMTEKVGPLWLRNKLPSYTGHDRAPYRT